MSAISSSYIDKTAKIESGCVFLNSHIQRHSFIGYDSIIINTDIGSFSSIANRVSVGGASHPLEFVSTSPVFLSHKDSVKTKFANHKYLPVIKTSIGNDVWIGEGVYIKSGVKIHDGAVIGMGAVVTKDVEPYSIVAGNPAKLIRFRFDPAVVEALQRLKWWDLSDSDLKRLGPYFNDPLLLLRAEGLL